MDPESDTLIPIRLSIVDNSLVFLGTLVMPLGNNARHRSCWIGNIGNEMPLNLSIECIPTQC